MAREVSLRSLGVLCLAGVIGCGGSPDSDDPDSVGALIELTLVREGPGPGRQAVEYAGEPTYLESEPVVSDPDFMHVEPVLRSGELALEFELWPEAGDRLLSVSRASIGESLAIVVDSELRSVSVILDALGPRGRMSIDATPEEGAELAEKVRSRWPPPD